MQTSLLSSKTLFCLSLSQSHTCFEKQRNKKKMMTPLQIQSSLQNQSFSLSLSSSLSYSNTLPFKQRVSVHYTNSVRAISVTCSLSKIHNHDTVDHERKPIAKWVVLYKRISMMENPELGSASVLNQWENEGKTLTQGELRRVVKELRKYRKHHSALQVYEWMNSRPERFRISESDAAIQLDLIAKVHGVSSAERYLLNLPNNLHDKRTYCALLNVYVRSRSKEKAESLLDLIRGSRYLINSLPFNLMMTLYMNLKDYGKVDMLVSEMKEKNIQLDIYTYNIWLSSCGSQESIEKMEQVFEQMSKDPTIISNWSTFSIMAEMYIKMELFEKAHECLKEIEGRILGRDQVPFHYLLSLYGNIGMKDEVYRVWNNYKSMFPSIPNSGYHAVISSLVRMDNIEGAERLYEEWVSVRPSDDSKVSNLIIGWYVKNGELDKAFNFVEHMIESGGCPNSTTWEILSEGHVAEKRISDALSCLKKAFLVTSGSTKWKPNPIGLAAFLKLCQDEDDMESAEVLIEMLRQSGYHKDEAYASLIGKDELSSTIERIDDIVDSENMDDDDDEDSQVVFNSVRAISVICSLSNIHNHDTVDHERKSIVKWVVLYKRISMMENPELGSDSVLDQWENEGTTLTQGELRRVVKELRKYRKHHSALQVYEWMNNRPERFRISESDAAIQLDLIAKVHGVSSAEGYFLNLANDLKYKRTYGALLNVYVRSRSKEKAEFLLDVMRSKRYLIHALPFNLMMTLYMNLKDYGKVDLLVSEMKEKNIQLDLYTYNIWLSSCGSQESIEKMEQVFEQMSKDPTIIPNWSTFSTMVATYIKMELFEKAHEFLKEIEGRILGRDRVPFHCLLSLYGNIGMKDEVYRVWNNYKSMFPSIPNSGYHAVISSLVRMDNIEDAEKLYEEWVLVRPSDDSRVANLILGWYLKSGELDKAFNFFEHMIEGGGSPNSTTWEILAEAHIAEKRISDALSCWKKAFVVTSDSMNWKPKPVKLTAFLKLCRDEDDMESAGVLIELLRQSGYHKDEAYASLIGKDELSSTIERIDDIVDSENMDDDDDEDSQVVFNQVDTSF